MNPELNPNPLYAYEVLSNSHESSEEYYPGEEFDAFFERIIEELDPNENEFESLWSIYKNRKSNLEKELSSPIPRKKMI